MTANFLRISLPLLFFFNICGTAVIAQITTSPWTRYGIGEYYPPAYSQGFAMGGLGVSLSDPSYLHLQNPASYAWLEMTVFETGIQGTTARQASVDEYQWKNNLTFSHLAFGLPVTRWLGLSFGLLPFSGTGYSINDSIEDPILGQYFTDYEGSGGINRVYLGTAFKIKNKLAAGINASYLFGTSHYNRRVRYTDPNSFSARSIESLRVSDFHFEAGLQYRTDISENWNLSAGLTMDFGGDMHSTKSSVIYTYREVNKLEFIRDTISFIEVEGKDVTLPSSVAGGLTFTGEKWTLGAEVRQRSWSDLEVFGRKDGLQDNLQFSLGAQLIPDKYAQNSFFRTLRYRVGIRRTGGYINMNGSPLDEYGISFGLGIPLRRSMSTLNAGVELSKRGAILPGQIEEQFIRFRFGLSINDQWFIKRRYN